MKLNDWLAAEKGRLTNLAQHFGLTPSAVSQWKDNGVPVDRMRAVCEFTGGAVSLDDLVPVPTPAQ
jgi:DNA-binding transcriptional regulator YdaS (Cro superfamily)